MLTPISVTLTYAEMMIAAQIGIMRLVQDLKLNCKPEHGADPVLGVWQTAVISCLGEMGVAKHLDRFWAGAIGNFFAADVGLAHQVRATDHEHGRLLLHDKDKDHMPYVLARVRLNVVTLVGWLYAREGKRQDWWGTLPGQPHRPCFIVPNNALHDMSEMPWDDVVITNCNVATIGTSAIEQRDLRAS
jgi:hypothetical protein